MNKQRRAELCKMAAGAQEGVQVGWDKQVPADMQEKFIWEGRKRRWKALTVHGSCWLTIERRSEGGVPSAAFAGN